MNPIENQPVDKSYLNTALTPAQRTEILLSQMTLEEKVGQLMQVTCMKADPKFENGKAIGWIYSRISDEDRHRWVSEKHAGSFLHVLGDEIDLIQKQSQQTRLGIPVLFGIDAVHGHALHNGATIFPSQLGMSCSWDLDLVQKAGRVTAKEVASDGIHWTFSPVLCIARDLRWGRVNETFGEDAFLIGEMGSALIKGYQNENLQGEDCILACAKHYIAYGESTGGRDSYDSQLSLRKVREVFLEPFEKAIQAGCATVMTGYQSIDGTPVTASETLVRKILKEELGFEGFVVTDWNNAESLVTQQRVAHDLSEASAMTLRAGNDMFMNTPGSYEALIEQVQSGGVHMAQLDEAVARILLTKFKLGLFEKTKSQWSVGSEAHHEVNMELTRKSFVLLKNEGNLLPLHNRSDSALKIAVIGPNADDIKAQYGDWTFFSHPFPKEEQPEKPYYTMREGIHKVGEKYGAVVSYHKGCHVMDKADQQIDEAKSLAESSDVVIAVVGDCLEQNGEFKDRANLDLSGEQQALLEALKSTGKPLVVVLVNGKPLSIPWIKNHADAVIETFNSGMFGGLVLGEILFGETIPSGKLSISFPQHSGQSPVYYNQLPGWHGSKYMDLPMEPLYPFGFGLSYTTFEYAQMRLSKACYEQGDTLEVQVDVKNCGDVAGEEVVELYIRDLVSSVVTPFKQLKGFSRVKIPAGQTQTITLSVPIASLYVVQANGKKVVEPGMFVAMVGPDSRDTSLLSMSFKVE